MNSSIKTIVSSVLFLTLFCTQIFYLIPTILLLVMNITLGSNIDTSLTNVGIFSALLYGTIYLINYTAKLFSRHLIDEEE